MSGHGMTVFFGLLRRSASRNDDSTLVNDRFSRSRWSLRMICVRGAKWGAKYLFYWVYLAFLRVRFHDICILYNSGRGGGFLLVFFV